MSELGAAILAWDADAWIAASFVPIAVLFIWALWRADRGKESTFKFVHFVTNDVGRGSYYALGYTMLVVVCSWGTWAMIVTKQISEWWLTIVIGGFVIGAIGGTAARVISKVKGTADPDPSAGDDPATPAPALEQTTNTQTKVSIPQPDVPTKKRGK